MALTITQAGLDLLRDNLAGIAGAQSPIITYVAVGTGVQGTPSTATQLAAESFRKQITSAPNGASHGETLFNGYLAPGDASGVAISEVGYFAGNASATANTGVLVFYVTYSHTHAANESVQLTVDSTI